MWVFAYDPADGKYVQRRNVSYWAMRHGSPVRDRVGVWVPTTFIPCLSEFSEVGDLYIGYLEAEDDPHRTQYYTPDESPSRELFQALKQLDPSDFAIGIEFTYHTNWSSNAIQRLRILYDSVVNGIPTVYAIPESGIALRGTERRGDRNLQQNALSKELSPVCEDLVRDDEPVTFDTLKTQLDKHIGGLDIEIETEVNDPDPKVPLFCRTMQDSYQTPIATVQYDQVLTAVPNDWKVAGCQLAPLYDIMAASMEYIENTGHAPTVDSGLYDEHNQRDDAVMQSSPPNRKGVSRNDTWDKYHTNRGGFPHGSLGIVTEPVERRSLDHNYSLPSNRLVRPTVRQQGEDAESFYNRWKDSADASREQRRFYSDVDVGRMPSEFADRELALTYTVSPYGGSKDHIERWQNVDERTYAGKMILLDVTCTRRSRGTADRPRAMARSRREREHLLTANLPMPSGVMLEQYESNARFRNFIDVADILVFDDGGYLGTMWWEEEPIKIFD